MKFKGNIAWLVVLLFSVAACSEEETPVNLPEGEISITAQIDEEEWEAAEYESALNVVPEKGQFFELTAFDNNYRITISVLEFDRATGTITEGTYEDNKFLSLFMATEDDSFVIEYKPLEAGEDEETPARIVITASTSSRISGTFTGVVYKTSQDPDNNYPEFLTITNGVFNNLPFETHTVNIQ